MGLPFIKEGLLNEERCIYVVGESAIDDVKEGLVGLGVGVDPHIRSGQLRILTVAETYLRSGRFSRVEMLSFLTLAVREALRVGYRGLRATGEVSWAVEKPELLDEFLRYEALVTSTFANRPVKLLCQYDTRNMTGDTILGVLDAHPFVRGLNTYQNPFHAE